MRSQPTRKTHHQTAQQNIVKICLLFLTFFAFFAFFLPLSPSRLKFFRFPPLTFSCLSPLFSLILHSQSTAKTHHQTAQKNIAKTWSAPEGQKNYRRALNNFPQKFRCIRWSWCLGNERERDKRKKKGIPGKKKQTKKKPTTSLPSLVLLLIVTISFHFEFIFCSIV